MMKFFSNYQSAFIVWLICSLYLAYQFIVRLSISVLREDIIMLHNLTTETFGILLGCYYLGYAGMQVPIGILLDRFHVKIITIIAILVNILGVILFLLSNSFGLLLFARFLVGASSATAFLSAVKTIKLYFPSQYHTLFFGFTCTIGLFGGVFGGAPMSKIFHSIGYHKTSWVLVFFSVLLIMMLCMVNKKTLKPLNSNGLSSVTLKHINKILFNPLIISIGLFGGMMVGSFEGFGDSWAMVYFQQIYGYSKVESNFLGVSSIYFGMGIGGPILAWFANRVKSVYFLVFICGAITSCIFTILFSYDKIQVIILLPMMILMGILCAYQVLIFSIGSSLVSSSFISLTTAFLNSLIMGFGYFVHVLVANRISDYWDGSFLNNGAPLYSKSSLLHGLYPVSFLCFVGATGFLLLAYYFKNKKPDIIKD